MRNEVVAAFVILLVIASAGVGYFIGSSSQRVTASVSTTTLTATTLPASSCGPFGCDISTTTFKSGQTTNTSTTCVILAEGEVLLQVLNSTTGRPISSVPVQGQLTPVPCGSNPQTIIPLNTVLTNGTGYAVFGPELGEYHLTLYTLGNYFVDVSTLPEKTTCVTLSIPSGETVIKYSATFQFSC